MDTRRFAYFSARRLAFAGGRGGFLDVTKAVLGLLADGVKPWESPYVNQGLHMNLASKRNYQGVFNAVMLDIACLTRQYPQACWLSYKQAQEQGGQGKKSWKFKATWLGRRAVSRMASNVPLPFAPLLCKRNEEEERPQAKALASESEEQTKPARTLLGFKTCTVFNLAQVG